MSRGRWLLPREHGAYAQLAFPLVTGVLVARFHPAATAFAISAVAWFLLHEPVTVLTGRRGRRLLDEYGERARRRGAALATLGAVAGAVGLALAPPSGRLAAVLPAGLALLLVPAVVRGRQKTLRAEAVVVAAFASMVLPLVMSGGTGWRYAWAAAAVWYASFLLSTIAVHAIKARYKRGRRPQWTVPATPALAVALLMAAGAAALTDAVAPVVALAVAPPALAILAVAIAAVHPRRLTRVGWTLTGANAVSLVMLVGGA